MYALTIWLPYTDDDKKYNDILVNIHECDSNYGFFDLLMKTKVCFI